MDGAGTKVRPQAPHRAVGEGPMQAHPGGWVASSSWVASVTGTMSAASRAQGSARSRPVPARARQSRGHQRRMRQGGAIAHARHQPGLTTGSGAFPLPAAGGCCSDARRASSTKRQRATATSPMPPRSPLMSRRSPTPRCGSPSLPVTRRRARGHEHMRAVGRPGSRQGQRTMRARSATSAASAAIRIS